MVVVVQGNDGRLHMVVVVLEKAPLVQKAVEVEALPALAPIGQPHGLG